MITNIYENPIANSVVVSVTCPFCGAKRTVTAKQNEFDDWNAGVMIQDAMPSLNADDREALMTGICDKCFPPLTYRT